MYMIFFVLHNPELLEQVLNAWEEAGVGGLPFYPAQVWHASVPKERGGMTSPCFQAWKIFKNTCKI